MIAYRTTLLEALALGAAFALAGGCEPSAKPEAKLAPVAAPPGVSVPVIKPVIVEPGMATPDEGFGPALPRTTEKYRIRTEDQIEIGVWGEDDMTRRLKVGPDGRISYFQATELQAAGRTIGELKVELWTIMKDYFKNPVVFVSLVDSAGNFVTVNGVVKNPGVFKINNETRLMDVMALCGGIPLATSSTGTVANQEVADLSQAFVLRGDKFLDVDFSKLFGGAADPREVVANNVLLEPNDRIFVPSAVKLENKIFVVGQVRNPHVIHYSKEITLLEALLEAGDVPEAAWERMSFIVRGRMNKPQIIEINTRKIRTGEQPDIRLQAGDVVFVPKTPLAKWADVCGQLDAIFTGVTAADAAYKVDFKRP